MVAITEAHSRVPTYGSLSPSTSRRRVSPRLKVVSFAVGLIALGLVAIALTSYHHGGSIKLMQEWRLGMPWEHYGYQPQEVWPDPLDDTVYEEATPGYNANTCIDNPFSELPPGFLCTSQRFGVYLIDPYGSLYNRRIQYKTRDVVRGSLNVFRNVADEVPEKEHERTVSAEHSHWVNPLKWLHPALVPNTSACQQSIAGFYDAISFPANKNLTNATDFLADDFVYEGPQASLLPACVPALSWGKKAVGSRAWVEAFQEQLEAFGEGTSELDGNVTCQIIRTKEPLEPRQKCVAKHLCTFALKTLKNETGGNITLTGEIMDTFWFDGDGKIVYMTTHVEPKEFHVLKPEVVGAALNSTNATNTTA